MSALTIWGGGCEHKYIRKWDLTVAANKFLLGYTMQYPVALSMIIKALLYPNVDLGRYIESVMMH